jgi:dienelactone hydrolase
MPPGDLALADQVGATLGHGAIDGEVLRYHGAAFLHEHLIAKYLNIFGASLAALTAYEDRVALNVLAERDDVDATRVAAVGFSGGGLRAAAVSATSDRLKATIVAGMMTTYEELLSRHIVPHTWMLFPAGLAQAGDMPDLAACAAPRPLMVVYALEDPLFTEKGMRDADARISEYYERAGVRENYRGVFFGGPHRFDREMQERVFQWLKERL